MGNKTSSSAYDVPEKMKRLVLVDPNPDDMSKAVIEVETVDTPKPRNGEVLIKVFGAPVNPSDYGEWMHAKVSERKPIGKEGSGLVIASGGGFYANSIVGKKVGFVNLRKQGSYSEYVTVNAMRGAFALPDDFSDAADAASFFVNPYTAVGILETAKSTKSPGFIHTAACSQLGKMIVKLLAEEPDMTLINVVRRKEQADTLRELGAKHVVVTGEGNESTWEEELKALAKEHGVTTAFDAIGGEMTGRLVALLPKKSSVYVYGKLGGDVKMLNPIDLIYFEKKIKGWFLGSWVKSGAGGSSSQVSMLLRLRAAHSRVVAGLQNGGWSSTVFKDTSLEDMFADFLEMYKTKGFTKHKLRIRMGEAEDATRA